MTKSIDRLVMFHGTSSVFLDDILKQGLLPAPPERLSTLMMTGEDGHTTAFEGVYLAASSDTAAHYAKKAAEIFGGDPVMVTATVPVAELVPDEDEILYDLKNSVARALGWDPDADDEGLPLKPWSTDAARESAEWVLREGSGGPHSEHAIAAAAEALGEMAEAAIRLSGRSTTSLFDYYAEDADGWSSPMWVSALTRTREGMAIYRNGMDRLTRAYIGAQPEDYPCGDDGCKGRLLAGLGFDGDGARIVGIGTLDYACTHYGDPADLTGVPRASAAEEWLEEAGAARSLALA